MTNSLCIQFSRIAGLLLSASLLGACALPSETDDEFNADADAALDDSDEEIAETEQEIVGGAYASGPYQFPYQVVILKNGVPNCGGSILRSRFILTAGHCVVGVSAGQLSVRAGEYNLNAWDGTEQTRAVALKHLHPGYADGPVTNDVAILELVSGLSQNAAVATIPLPTSPAVVGGNSIASGWGDTYSGSQGSAILKYTSLPIVSNASCNAAPLWRDLNSNELCAGYSNGSTDTCFGDSGGPLVQSGRVVGIVSWGTDACNNYGVYTDVYDHLAWIKGITGL